MKNFLNQQKKNQGGYGVVIVIVLLFLFFAAVISGVTVNLRTDSSTENLVKRDKEKWEAKSAMATLRRVIEVRLPARYAGDLDTAQRCPNSSATAIKAFDPIDLPVEQSRPVLSNTPGLKSCSSLGSGEQFTSYLGNSELWAQNYKSDWTYEVIDNIGYSEAQINIASIKESLRRFSGTSGANEQYQFSYIIDTRGGQHFSLRENGEIFVGTVAPNCNVISPIQINPLTIQEGESTTLSVYYANASRLRILRSNNSVLQEVNVTESPNIQTYTLTLTPTATESYRVEALSSVAGCFTRTPPQQVVVTSKPPPPCAISNSFTASSTDVFIGDTVTLNWATSNATEVTIEGEILPASGSRNYVINTSRTFTLRAHNNVATCSDSTLQVTVNARPRPPCAPSPTIDNFNGSPLTVLSGSGTTLYYSVSNLQAGYQLYIIGSNGTSYTLSGSSGSVNIDPNSIRNAGEYTYTLYAKNICGDGTEFQVSAQVKITTNSCPTPGASFSASPNNFVLGTGTTLYWDVSNVQPGGYTYITRADNGNYYGNFGPAGSQGVDQSFFTAAGTYTYTLNTVSCGVTYQTNTSVVVSNPAPPPPPSAPCGNKTLYGQEIIGPEAPVTVSATVDFINLSGTNDYDIIVSWSTSGETIVPTYVYVYYPGNGFLIDGNLITEAEKNNRQVTRRVTFSGGGGAVEFSGGFKAGGHLNSNPSEMWEQDVSFNDSKSCP